MNATKYYQKDECENKYQFLPYIMYPGVLRQRPPPCLLSNGLVWNERAVSLEDDSTGLWATTS